MHYVNMKKHTAEGEAEGEDFSVETMWYGNYFVNYINHFLFKLFNPTTIPILPVHCLDLGVKDTCI